MKYKAQPKWMHVTNRNSLNDQEIEELRQDALATVDAQMLEWNMYWEKMRAIQRAIEDAFPTERRGNRRKAVHHRLLNYAIKIAAEEAPGVAPGMSAFNEWVDKIHQARRDAQEKDQQAAIIRAHSRVNRHEKDIEAVRFGALRGWMNINTVEDFIQKARETDKYLDLAIAVEQTDTAPSEGYYRVQMALGRFVIESSQDREIREDLRKTMNSLIEWGYHNRPWWTHYRLHSLVEPTLLTQYKDLTRSY